MANKTVEHERDAVDLITDCMYSLGYLQSISDATFSDEKNQVTVGQFYAEWLKASGCPRIIIPFNPGIFLAYLYVGILYAKENWFELLPNDAIEHCQDDWGLRGAPINCPKQSSPSIRYAVRRIRNSLGHGHPTVSIPQDISKDQMFARISISFHDKSVRDASHTFDIVLTLDQLVRLVKKFQSVVHRHVREKS